MQELFPQRLALAMWACWLLVLVSCGRDGRPQPKADRAASAGETRVSGTLVAASDQPETGKRVLLISGRLVNVEGKEVVKLPPREDVIIDADVSHPAATARTDSSGRFEIEAVKPGRYLLGVVSSSEGAFSRADITFLQRPGDEFDTLVFDVAPAQPVELGRVRAKGK